MAAPVRDRFPLFVAGGVLLVGALGAFLWRGAERSDYADLLSTYRASPHGARALYLLAEEAGLPVARHQSDLELPPKDGALVLLAVHTEEGTPLEGEVPPAGDGGVPLPQALVASLHAEHDVFTPPATDDEVERVLQYVQEGHTLVYVPCETSTDRLLRAAAFSVRRADPELGMRTLVPAQPAPHTLGVESAEAHVQGYLDYSEHAVPLLVDAQLDGAVAAVAPYGAGHIVVVSSPELAMNRALARADNARFWLSLLRTAAAGGPIWFDEFHHGFSDDRSIAQFAIRYRLHLAIAQLLLGLLLWGVALRRFGRPRRPPLDEREGGLDALLATSRLYREGGHHPYAAKLIAQGLAQELAPRAGQSPRATPAQVAEALRARSLVQEADALAEVDAIAENAGHDRDVEKVARAAARARATLEHRRHPRSPPT